MKPVRLISPPGTYFITFTTWQRQRLFVVESYVRLFLKTLYGYRRDGRYRMYAFVLMPEHVHLLLTPADEVTIERAIQLIKGGIRTLSEKLSDGNVKCGSGDSPTTEFVICRILPTIRPIFIKIRSSLTVC